MMTGTSPFTFNSPSFHSSSYLPKLEAEFCRDFSCCGIPLPSLHDLLRHYEEHHAQQNTMDNGVTNVQNDTQNRIPQPSNAGMGATIGGIGGIQMEMMRQRQLQQQRQAQEEAAMQDDQRESEVTGDMDMDEDEMTPPPNQQAMAPQTHMGQQHMQHTQPNAHMGQTSYNTTPNMQNAHMQNFGGQASPFSPDSSVPGTPLANDQMDFTFPQNLGYQQQPNFNMPYANMGIGTGDMSLDMCIDEPAKRLFSPGGQQMGGYNAAQLQMLMNANQVQRLPGDGLVQQAPTMQAHLMQQEEKPFKCPVIGCEKAYKNQNGLKYHKAVCFLYSGFCSLEY